MHCSQAVNLLYQAQWEASVPKWPSDALKYCNRAAEKLTYGGCHLSRSSCFIHASVAHLVPTACSTSTGRQSHQYSKRALTSNLKLAFAVAAAVLQTLQQFVTHSAPHHGCFAVRSVLDMPEGPGGAHLGLWTASVGALAKVVAAEHPDLLITSMQISALMHSGLRTHLACLGASAPVSFSPPDAYGLTIGGAVIRDCCLLPCAAPDRGLHAQSAKLEHSGLMIAVSRTRRVIITGGMGGLGRLVGSWMAWVGVCHMQLLGRSAHIIAAQLSATCTNLFLQSERCDVALADDAAAVLSCAGDTVLVHAAGQLQDGALQRQRLDMLRGTFAPKVRWRSQVLRNSAVKKKLYGLLTGLMR